MVLVPAGVIHRPTTEEEVRVEAFYIDRLPVTNKDYLEFVKATGYRPPKYLEDEEMALPALPVVGVSFYDAVQYATWAGKLIPTSDQWTLAATGGEKVRYPWGDEFRTEFAVYAGNAKGIEPSGEREGNVSSVGVHDLVGNKWEWTSTWFDEKEEYKTIRGGAWCDPPEFLTIDIQMYASPKEKIDILGFRCVRLP
jgi:formylglycine-generating enzyme required for sulfatase activity